MYDVFGAEVGEIKEKRLFLFDVDGTISNDGEVFPWTIHLLSLIHQLGCRYVFITNNTSDSVDGYIQKISRMGVPANWDNFFTASQATALYLNEHYAGKKVFCLGTKALIEDLRNARIHITEKVEADIDVVLVAYDTELTYEKLRNTCEALNGDVVFLATNPDIRCPASFGFVPDCGSICQMIENATGKKVQHYIGKPDPIMVNYIRELFGYSAEETCVVGNRLYTDIAVAENAGVTSICVLTGEATKEDIEQSPVKPTFTVNSVENIWRYIFNYKAMGFYRNVIRHERA